MQVRQLDLPGRGRSVHEAKRYAEALTAAYRREGLADTVIARVFGSYGPGMRPDDGPKQTWSLCHADDVARGLLLLAASDLGGPVNIANPDEAIVGQIAARIISLAVLCVAGSAGQCWGPLDQGVSLLIAAGSRSRGRDREVIAT